MSIPSNTGNELADEKDKAIPRKDFIKKYLHSFLDNKNKAVDITSQERKSSGQDVLETPVSQPSRFDKNKILYAGLAVLAIIVLMYADATTADMIIRSVLAFAILYGLVLVSKIL